MERIALALCLILVPPGSAPATEGPLPAGTLYLSLSPDADELQYQDGGLPASSPDTVELYLLARVEFGRLGEPDQDGQHHMLGWEACLAPWGEFELIDMEFLVPGQDRGEGQLNFIVDLDAPLPLSTSPVALARFSIQGHAESQASLALTASDPSRFGRRPGWVDGDAGAGCLEPPCERAFQGLSRLGGVYDLHPVRFDRFGPDYCHTSFERQPAPQVLLGGEVTTLAWSTNAGGSYVWRMEFSTDGGESWTGFWEPSLGLNGYYRWTVPNVQADRALLRICDDCCWAGPYHSYSDTFRIQKKVPTSGSSWGALKGRP